MELLIWMGVLFCYDKYGFISIGELQFKNDYYKDFDWCISDYL